MKFVMNMILTKRKLLSKINDTTYRVDGSVIWLDDLNDELGTKLESEDNDSVGGLIVERRQTS